MFRKDPLFIPGWIYFFLMFPLASRLPESFGCENGIIENLQIFWLFGGLILCSAAHDHRFQDWGGRPYTLWKAGILYYFLLIMREISWGRTFFPTANGGFWVGERTAFFLFSGELAEELAEFGAYMMMFMMTKEAEQRLRQHT